MKGRNQRIAGGHPAGYACAQDQVFVDNDRAQTSHANGQNEAGRNPLTQDQQFQHFTHIDIIGSNRHHVISERIHPYGIQEEGVVPVLGLSFPSIRDEGVAPTSNERRIKNLPEEDRPREKLFSRGLSALADYELLALLLATGTRQKSALELSRLLLDKVQGLGGLGNCEIQDLVQLEGIGQAKASVILAAFELGKRRQAAMKSRTRYTLPSDIAEYLRPSLAQQPEEVFKVLFMDNSNHIVAERELFRGGLSGVVVDPRVVFRYALQYRATRIVLSHNHPSGDVTPSEEDCQLTQSILQMGQIVDVKIVDHLILSDWGYYSMADEGLLSRLQRADWSFRTFKREMQTQIRKLSTWSAAKG